MTSGRNSPGLIPTSTGTAYHTLMRIATTKSFFGLDAEKENIVMLGSYNKKTPKTQKT